MSYCFDQLKDRRNSGCTKWNVKENELPMSMADMDFETAPEIKKVFADRIEHGVFGYADLPDTWYDAYIDWWAARHQFNIQRDWLIYSAGVIPTISSVIRKLTTPAEKVAVLTPSYNIFYNSILNNGRVVAECPLCCHEGTYDIDFALLEETLSDPQVSILVLCNPHNPVGKIWGRDTLLQITALCRKYGVLVLSDEIHCDLTDPGKEYIPYVSISPDAAQISITCVSPTKAFNLAGIQSSAVIVPNPVLRHRVWRGLNTDEVGEASILGAITPNAAFGQGGAWLDALRQYVFENKSYVRDYVARQVKEVRITPSEATYLLWLDCRAVSEHSTPLAGFLKENTGLILIDGAGYGQGGDGFLRINLACPRCTAEDGMERFARGVRAFLEQK
ncbi:PatB family C-S lyase [Oscillospiraceae bacterium 50-60]